MSLGISIIIPSLNSESEIERCLASLKLQLSGEDEVLIVDAGSKDKTLQIAYRYGCKVLSYLDSNIGEARDAGVSQSQNEVIISTDTDVEFTEGFLDKVRRYFEDSPELVGLSCGWRDGKGKWLGQIGCALFENMFHYADCIQCFRKSAYYRTNGFPPVSWGEQISLWNQIKQTGLTVFDPQLFVLHFSDGHAQYMSYIIGASILAGGAAYEYGVGGEAGYAMIGHGLGWLASQAGVDMLKKVEGMEEFWADPHHFPHHWQIAVMILAGTLAFSDELPSELEMALYGFSTAMFLHDALTEPRS